MALTADEQKALAHIAQEKKRAGFQRFLASKLVAPPTRAAQTKKNWAPLTNTGRIKGQSG